MNNDTFTIRQLTALPTPLESQDFEAEYWKQQPATTVLAGGRGESLKIERDGFSYVLHPYLRGGAVARLLNDKYLWSELATTRPFQEHLVIEKALQVGLPVPRMIGFRIQRSGMFYRAVSLNEYIANRGSLASCLFESPLSQDLWESLGGLIRDMHKQAINHVDLNADNILLNEQNQWYIIDFDRAQIQDESGSQWQQRNLNRLLRSLHKIQSFCRKNGQDFYFEAEHWLCLVKAYESS